MTRRPLGVLLYTVGCAPPVELGSTLPDRLRTDVLSSVVLIVKELPDAKIGYGAGIRVGEQRVLTNAHVVEDAVRIAVLPWRPDRATYIDVDGGLSRMLYESQPELRTAHLLRADVQLDLAVIKVPELAPLQHPLKWSDRPVELGQPIIAVGHPNGEVWTVSSGHISALHQGVIQHDAPLNKGNSGGPLLDRAGHVVGVNTRKPLGRTEGIGFARPVALAQALLDEGADGGTTLDRSGPKVAFQSCMRASELGRADPGCVDWNDLREAILESIVQRARSEGYSEAAITELGRASRAALTVDQVRAAFVDRPELRARVLSIWGGLVLSAPLKLDDRPDVVDADTPYAPTSSGALADDHGLRVDIDSPEALHAVLRNGLRVADLWPVDEHATWLRVEGRNSDGSSYQLAQLMTGGSAGWRLCLAPDEAVVEELPDDWPRPLTTRADVVAAFAQTATLRKE